jgi:hypothetical protein
VLVALVACGPTVASPSPSSLATEAPPSEGDATALLTGPWRPAPVTVDPNLIAAIEFICKNPADTDLKAAIEHVPVALVDARGDSLVSIILADEHVAFECRVKLEDVAGEFGATILEPPSRLVPAATEPLEAEDIRVVSHGRVDEETGSRTILIGRVGSAPQRVIVGFNDQSEVFASMDNGWYTAWWPGVDEPGTIAGVDRQSVVIRGVQDPSAMVEGRVGPAAWWVDPAMGPIAPEATTIPALIRERLCASGQTPEDRLVDPVVFSSEDAVLVNVWVRMLPGGQDCQGNPEFPIEISLTEPLGDRQLLDGSEVPPRDASGPPQ